MNSGLAELQRPRIHRIVRIIREPVKSLFIAAGGSAGFEFHDDALAEADLVAALQEDGLTADFPVIDKGAIGRAFV